MTKPVTAVAAMILVEETKLKLDLPVNPWLPELADRKVLRVIDAGLDDTVPADRPITLRDLLKYRMGFDAIMSPPSLFPIQAAVAEAGMLPSPFSPRVVSSEWMAGLGRLPLLHQPGEQWMYHTASDVLGVLIARSSGTSLGSFMSQRIFEPLGMKDTAFSVPDHKISRLATCYGYESEVKKLEIIDPARGGSWSLPPTFESGGGGLTSTADDFLAFGRMMVNFGRLGSERVLARPTVELMMSDQLTPGQKAASPFFPGFWDTRGWGFGASVVTRRETVGPAVGSYTWNGGFGTFWCADPKEQTVCVFMNQRMMSAPLPDEINQDFYTLAYQEIED